MFSIVGGLRVKAAKLGCNENRVVVAKLGCKGNAGYLLLGITLLCFGDHLGILLMLMQPLVIVGVAS